MDTERTLPTGNFRRSTAVVLALIVGFGIYQYTQEQKQNRYKGCMSAEELMGTPEWQATIECEAEAGL
jgi:uncharacterized protein HemX